MINIECPWCNSQVQIDKLLFNCPVCNRSVLLRPFAISEISIEKACLEYMSRLAEASKVDDEQNTN